MSETGIRSFEVTVRDEQIADLSARLDHVRWPDQLPNDDWRYGTERGYLQELCRYWRESFSWSGFEQRLNAHPQFLTEIDGEQLHFYYLKSPHPAAKPLLLLHGWPGSVVEFLDVMAPLADPSSHGRPAADAFHVIVPSLPGFGFSGPTRRPGIDRACISAMLTILMERLGFDRFLVQGTDWGALIACYMAHSLPDRVAALHLTLAPATPPNPDDPTEGLSEQELVSLGRMAAFQARESGYSLLQSTKPQTLAYGLTDSPVGLAAWIIEKFVGWSDCGPDIERDFRRDALLDNISVYWLTGTINSSCRLYFEETPAGRPFNYLKVDVPTGLARFAGEPFTFPQSWVRSIYNVQHCSEFAKGGHFAAMQVPDLFLGDVVAFFRPYACR